MDIKLHGRRLKPGKGELYSKFHHILIKFALKNEIISSQFGKRVEGRGWGFD